MATETITAETEATEVTAEEATEATETEETEAPELKNQFLAQVSVKMAEELADYRLVLVRVLHGAKSEAVKLPEFGAIAASLGKTLTKGLEADAAPWFGVTVKERREGTAAGPGPSYEILTIADTEPSTKPKATGRKKQLDEAKLRADIKAGRAAGQTRREAFFAAYLAQNFSEAQATEAWNDLYGDD